MIQSIVAFILALMCYSISQLQQHGKLRWSKSSFGFWGTDSDVRKYKKDSSYDPLGYARFPAPKTWYYRLIKSNYKERWVTSTWLTVAYTDGYHACQSLMFILLSLGISQLSDINFFIVWPSLLVVFSLTYRLLLR